MKTLPGTRLTTAVRMTMLAVLVLFSPGRACAVVTVFFDASQTTNFVTSGATSETWGSEGYWFTVTRDKLFTGGVGLTNPIGRYLRVQWPDGLEAQAVTAGPNPGGAKLILKREDGQPFAINRFTMRLLANTGGAGGSWEIMPQLNGEDARNDPYFYIASGTAGNQFTYVTPELAGYDAYKISLYVDFALMELTVTDASLPPPVLEWFVPGPDTLQLSWPDDGRVFVLQSTTTLPSTGWTTVTNPVVVAGGYNFVDVPLGGQGRFFRLRQ